MNAECLRIKLQRISALIAGTVIAALIILEIANDGIGILSNLIAGIIQ